LKASEKYILNSCAARGDGNDVKYSWGRDIFKHFPYSNVYGEPINLWRGLFHWNHKKEFEVGITITFKVK